MSNSVNYGKWTFKIIGDSFSAYDIVVGLNNIFNHTNDRLVLRHEDYSNGVNSTVRIISSNYISDMELCVEFLKKEYGIEYKEGMEPKVWHKWSIPKYKEFNYDPDLCRDEDCDQVCCGTHLDSLKPCGPYISANEVLRQTLVKKIENAGIFVNPNMKEAGIEELFSFVLQLYSHKDYIADLRDKDVKTLQKARDELKTRIKELENKSFSFEPNTLLICGCTMIDSNALRKAFDIPESVKDNMVLSWLQNKARVDKELISKIENLEDELQSVKEKNTVACRRRAHYETLYKTCSDANTSIKEKCMEREKEIAKLKKELSELKKQYEFCCKDNNDISVRLWDAREELRKLKDERDDLSARIGRCEELNVLNRDIIVDLTEQLQKAKRSLSENEDDADATSELIEGLKEKLKKAEADYISLQTEKSDALFTTQSAIDALKKRVRDLEERLKSKSDEDSDICGF